MDELKKRRENFDRARNEMKKHIGESLTHELIKSIHAMIEQDHEYRTINSVVVRNLAGRVVYYPNSGTISKHDEIEKLLEYVKQSREPAEEVAAKFYWGFVKIHPFLNGNGRTARIFFSFILLNHHYDDDICKKLEGYLQPDVEEYWHALDDNEISYYGFENVSQQWLTYVSKAFKEVRMQGIAPISATAAAKLWVGRNTNN